MSPRMRSVSASGGPGSGPMPCATSASVPSVDLRISFTSRLSRAMIVGELADGMTNLRGLQHLRLPGLQIDRAMDVQALAPGGLLDPNGYVLRRPTSCRPRLMRGMY